MAMRCDNAPEFTRLNSGPQGAPNLLKYLNVSVEPWGRCLAIAELVYNGDASDVTFGATRYFEISLDPDEVENKSDRRAAWSKDGSMVWTCDWGTFHFFKPTTF
jgi:hypothetical protein